MKKRLALALLGAFAAIVGIALFRAVTVTSKQVQTTPVEETVDRAAVERFQAALRFPTVSFDDRSLSDTAAFEGLQAHFEAAYPTLHATLGRESVGGLSQLYTWTGTDPSLPPVVLMGHVDVVPVIPGTEDDWEHPPFGGEVSDGFIWGRGTLDDKISVVAILEAAEALLSGGFRPTRTIYLAFGHDEEIGGDGGAGLIVEALGQRGVRSIALVLDEGGAIADGLVPGATGPVALVGIAEKGFVTLELSVATAGGHSSAPPDHTSIGILAEAITRLEANPFPADLEGATRHMFEYLAPEMPLGARLVMANLWLTEPLLERMLLGSRTGAPMLRTTTAVTVIDGGVKSNVLPIEATALVNFRIIPGETPETVLARVVDVVDDPRVEIRIVEGRAPAPVSDPESDAFRILAKTIRETAPEGTVVAPYLVPGGTDARHYSEVSANVFRFLPAVASGDELERIHGTNERIPLEGFLRSVGFFQRLIRNLEDLP